MNEVVKVNDESKFRRAEVLPLPTVKQIENALHELLTAIIAHDRKLSKIRAAQDSSSVRVSMYALGNTDFVPGEEYIGNPIGESLRHGVTALGKALFALTNSTDEMQEVCDRVCDRDPDNRHKRADILSKRWDGIGDWLA